MVSEAVLLEGSWYALEQAGRLLTKAVKLGHAESVPGPNNSGPAKSGGLGTIPYPS
jgi:hypothetical protein